MSLTKPYLLAVGILAVLFGVIYLFVPTTMTDPAGFGPLRGSALTDIRATYGGFQIGMGAFLLWSAAAEDRMRGGLTLITLYLIRKS